MFDGLDQIAWHTLSHAYGEADEVPKWLRALATWDGRDESDAFTELSLSLYHQGTVYSASAYATPFLLELLSNDTSPFTASLLFLLASFAHGDAYHRQHFHLYPDERRQDPALQQELAEQIGWVERTHEAVRQGMHLYQTLLAHSEPQIRMHAAYVLAQFREDATTSVPLLQSLILQESDQRVAASMMLSLANLCEPTDQHISFLNKILAKEVGEEEMSLVRFITSIALAWLARQETPQEAVDILVDVLTQPRPLLLSTLFVELPWIYSSIAQFAGQTLRWSLSRERLRPLIPRLINALEVVDAYDVRDVIKVLLYISFGYTERVDMTFPEPMLREHLTNEQQVLLSALTQSYGAWHSAPGVYSESTTWLTTEAMVNGEPATTSFVMNDDLQSLGLPYTQQDLQEFLNSEH